MESILTGICINLPALLISNRTFSLGIELIDFFISSAYEMFTEPIFVMRSLGWMFAELAAPDGITPPTKGFILYSTSRPKKVNGLDWDSAFGKKLSTWTLISNISIISWRLMPSTIEPE